MSNKYRLFILILISVILINFVYEQKVKAEAITITAGLYVFLQAAYAAGLTYLGTEAVNRLVEDSNVLYVEFKKHIENKPPEEKPPHDWEKTAILTMLGLQLGDSFKRLVDSVKDFFQELGSKEGENIINISYPQNGYLNGFKYDIVNKIENVEKYGWFNSEIIIDDSYKFSLYSIGSNYHFSSPSFPYLNIYKLENNEVVIDFIMNIPVVRFHAYGTVSENLEIKKIIYTKQILSTTDIEDSPKDGIRYIFDGGTYQFTNNPDDIRPVSPNLSVLPKEKLLEDNGKIVYEGTQEDLVNDLIANADPDNLFDTNPNPQPIEEIAPGKIVIGDSPGANPDPGTEPGTNPDPGTDPNDLLDKVFDPDTKEKLDTDKLKKERNFTTRFPFSIPWDIARVIRLFAKSPSPPDLGVNIDTTNLKLNYDINLSQIDLPIRFFRYATTAWFILFLASKTRDLIKW